MTGHYSIMVFYILSNNNNNNNRQYKAPSVSVDAGIVVRSSEVERLGLGKFVWGLDFGVGKSTVKMGGRKMLSGSFLKVMDLSSLRVSAFSWLQNIIPSK